MSSPPASDPRVTVLLFGATGTAGSGILRACLADAVVREVRVVVRRPMPLTHQKLRVSVHDDYLEYGAVRETFVGIDACFYALGKSVQQVSGEAEYRKITHGMAMAAARAVAAASAGAVFHFISGQSTALDSRFMWARVKAETERDLAAVVPVVCWRPGFIDGGATQTGPVLYRMIRPAFRLLRGVRSLYVSSDDIGRAMIEATINGRRAGVIENTEIRRLADERRS